uniref:hydroxyethylthiazole kinase n=1 Tax=Volvox carteri f. nagariensis TaxID=3068 RepID=D9CJ37_VOLCA|nr:THI10f [Volvox carteri f. nagariensis]
MAESDYADGQLQLEATSESCWQLWQAVRAKRPLVHCITNFVSMDIMANVLLAAGCSPAMAHSLDEVESFIAISSALLVNMGTLSPDWVAAKKLAAKKAVQLGKPWVLDPVGCGATAVRTASCLELLSCGPTVVRGNASEVLALAGAAGSGVRGVDSTAASSDALEAAKALASKHGCIVAVSGAVDYVTDGRRVVAVCNGHELLTLITAAGCSLTALIAAFLAAVPPPDHLLATAHALAVFGLAAEEGLKLTPRPGPGSLRVALMDCLHLMSKEAVLAGARIGVLVS